MSQTVVHRNNRGRTLGHHNGPSSLSHDTYVQAKVNAYVMDSWRTTRYVARCASMSPPLVPPVREGGSHQAPSAERSANWASSRIVLRWCTSVDGHKVWVVPYLSLGVYAVIGSLGLHAECKTWGWLWECQRHFRIFPYSFLESWPSCKVVLVTFLSTVPSKMHHVHTLSAYWSSSSAKFNYWRPCSHWGSISNHPEISWWSGCRFRCL
jgi:hypothetical protein